MATTLDVVNDCLASMGETPLNTLAEPHEFKASAQKQLAKANRRIQGPGWWFNTEDYTVSPAPGTGHGVLPGDTIKWQSGVRKSDTLVNGQSKPWIVQRGGRLYDTRTRTYVLTEDVIGNIVRLVPFADLPPVINDYIAAEAVLRFQSLFDADNSKRQELQQEVTLARAQANAENIRQQRVNMLNNNSRLARIRRVTNRYN